MYNPFDLVASISISAGKMLINSVSNFKSIVIVVVGINNRDIETDGQTNKSSYSFRYGSKKCLPMNNLEDEYQRIIYFSLKMI